MAEEMDGRTFLPGLLGILSGDDLKTLQSRTLKTIATAATRYVAYNFLLMAYCYNISM